jgi:Xaa-Pro aminopeptidase
MSIKSKVEIEKLKAAARKTREVHELIFQQEWIGRTEKEIADFADQRLGDLSFDTLVGAGIHATEVHAQPGHQIIRQGDLVIVDIGAKVAGFCGDMTRTFSAGGSMSEEQDLIFRIVLAAQEHAFAKVQIGTTLGSIHQAVKEFFGEQLLSHGILGDNDHDKLDSLFPHKTSHWIGREVHEKSPYEAPLCEGMTFTVEPGLYFHPSLGIQKYSGIGVRIEDMVLMTAKGFEVLTKS